MNREEILSHVDHTLLKPEATWPQIQTLCDEAIANHTASVCINTCYVKQAVEYMAGRIPVCCGTTLHCPECHTSTRQTPHLTKANATLEHSRNAAFTLSKCGISDDEVWHSGQQATRLKKQPIFRKKLPRIFP